MEQKTNQNNLEKKFKQLVAEKNLTIKSIEDLMLEEIESYKKQLKLQLEDLIIREVDEKNLIAKKTIMERKRIRIKV